MAKPKQLPRVAVLMSTYNGERFLREQLDCIRDQQGVEVQLFVRDDGSTDSTLAILKDYAHLWPQLAKIAPGPNLRAAKSFLALLQAAPGGFDYYAFADQDDWWAPDKLARGVAMIEASGEGPRLYCSHVTCTDEDLTPLGELSRNDDTRFEHLVFENIAYGCTVVMNVAARGLVADQPPEAGVAMHDWWCAMAAAAFGQVIFDPEPRILYRQHGANDTGTQPYRLMEIGRQLRVLRRNPNAFYPIHAQCSEFLRLHGDRLKPQHRRLLERVVRSKRSLPARLWFALTAPVVRQRLTTNIASRGLFALGWY